MKEFDTEKALVTFNDGTVVAIPNPQNVDVDLENHKIYIGLLTIDIKTITDKDGNVTWRSNG